MLRLLTNALFELVWILAVALALVIGFVVMTAYLFFVVFPPIDSVVI